MALPQGLNLQMMQNRWASFLDPLLRRPLVNGVTLTDIDLAIGDNVINHRLGRKPQGWIIVDIQGASSLYRSADFNDLTLTINSSAAVTASFYIY